MSSLRWAAVLTLALVAVGPTACATAAASDAIVRMRSDLRFDPAVVEIDVDATVTWENDGGMAHTVTQIDAEGNLAPTGFQSDEVVGTGRFSYRFTDPGTYAYRCEFHGDREMVGVVVVEP